jgi:hypothetical protein
MGDKYLLGTSSESIQSDNTAGEGGRGGDEHLTCPLFAVATGGSGNWG